MEAAPLNRIQNARPFGWRLASPDPIASVSHARHLTQHRPDGLILPSPFKLRIQKQIQTHRRVYILSTVLWAEACSELDASNGIEPTEPTEDSNLVSWEVLLSHNIEVSNPGAGMQNV